MKTSRLLLLQTQATAIDLVMIVSRRKKRLNIARMNGLVAMVLMLMRVAQRKKKSDESSQSAVAGGFGASGAVLDQKLRQAAANRAFDHSVLTALGLRSGANAMHGVGKKAGWVKGEKPLGGAWVTGWMFVAATEAAGDAVFQSELIDSIKLPKEAEKACEVQAR